MDLHQTVMGRKEGEKGWDMETLGGGSGPVSLFRDACLRKESGELQIVLDLGIFAHA